MITKLGLGIVAFDDTLHLKNIIAEIRDSVDVVVVCLQKLSYHGDPIDTQVVDYIENLKGEGFVDDIIWFESINEYDKNDPSTPRYIETDKRNFIIEHLESLGCSHDLIIDSDEFYDGEDFKTAKSIINGDENLRVTYCQYSNYYRDYRHVMVWPFEAFVPFITEIKYRFDFHTASFNRPSDPTRRYHIPEEGGRFVIFKYEIVKMHHLSWIRRDINDKIDNWSSKKYFDNIKGLKEMIIDRYNNYKDGENAIITFNVPNFEVVVNTLPDVYIHPKYNLLDV